MGMIELQTKEGLELPEACKGKKGLSFRAFEGRVALPTPLASGEPLWSAGGFVDLCSQFKSHAWEVRTENF